MSLTKSAELLGSILFLPHQFCCLLGERSQTLGLANLFADHFPSVSRGILQPRAHVTARE
ncbi:hypothetical protein E2C01_071467 [Portunus trituberculatus]|uniref:Uncharacterized protein n=1 Tax=Portunus trituberculatus TaxID=210409 RepID=A0A5B7I826_PORTR|nr:hypothetical protein [Portunus trituberculatus]